MLRSESLPEHGYDLKLHYLLPNFGLSDNGGAKLTHDYELLSMNSQKREKAGV